MRIAFVSCFSTRILPKAPVWQWIADAQPDHLVLLGDSIYLDVASDGRPQDQTELEFAQNLHALYSELLADPRFSALVRQLPPGHVHSIWDDHDFLWNDAEGAAVAADPKQADKIPLTTAFQEAFRRALAQQIGPGSFPADALDAAFWTRPQPPLATPSIALAPDLFLHLLDGRTHRTRTWLVPDDKRAIVGRAQLQRLRSRVMAAPADAVHLVASGSTIAGWQKFARDLEALLDIASTRRLMVLSGDIHRNNLDGFGTTGLPLHEATSSGAAIRAAVAIGAPRHNHGLLDVTAQALEVRLFKKNTLEHGRRILRASWLPV
jgi:alkaline phosphatase D